MADNADNADKADDKETKSKEEASKTLMEGLLTFFQNAPSKYDEEYERRSSSLVSEDSLNAQVPWYQAFIPTKLRALFRKARVSIQNAESWAEYQDDPDWSFPMLKAHVYLLDKSGAPNWFPIGPALKFLNQQTAISAVRQFSTYSMERIHHYAMNGESLHSLYAARKLVDVLIHIKDRSFYAHRCVLCTHSEFFATILLENDIPPYAVTDITLKHIDPDIFKRFLHFIYTGDVFVNLSNLYALRRLANILKAKSLKAKLMIFMAETGAMNLEEAIKILVEDSDQDAMPMAVEVVKSNFKNVMDDARLQQFSFENFLEIVSGDNLCVNTELDVFWAVLFWVAHDYANRVNHFPQLMSEVRFTCMTSLELMDCAKVTDMIKLSEKCKKLLINANWVCHAREIGLEDPLSLPEHPQRQCLIDTPHTAPTVEEFDKRFLKYMKLMSKEIGTVTKQSENTRQNAKRVYFAQSEDDDKADTHLPEEEDLSELEERPMGDNVKRRRSSSLKEVFVRKESIPEEDEHKGSEGESAPPPAKPQAEFRSKHFKAKEEAGTKGQKIEERPSEPLGKDAKKKKKKKKKNKSGDDGDQLSGESSDTSVTSGSSESSLSETEKGGKKKKKHKKGKGKGKHGKSEVKDEPEQGDAQKKGGFFKDLFQKKNKDNTTPQTSQSDESRSSSSTSLSESDMSSKGMPESKREKKKKMKKKDKADKKDKGGKKKKKHKHKDKDKGKEGGEKKKKKHKKNKDKNQQNIAASTPESESLEDSNSTPTSPSPELDGETNITLNKSQDSRDEGHRANDMKLLDLSNSFILEPENRSGVDVLSLWENSVFPVQENCMLGGSILLPIPRQKVVLTKTHEDVQAAKSTPEGSGSQ